MIYCYFLYAKILFKDFYIYVHEEYWSPVFFCLGGFDISIQFSSVAQLCLSLCDPMDPGAHQASCPSPAPGVCSNSCPLSWWCHPTISSSVIPFSSCLQSFPASGGQSIGVLASASVLPMNFQGWFPLGWTGWISFQSKGLSRVFSNTTVQKHQFFSTQLSLWSNSYPTWLLEKP